MDNPRRRLEELVFTAIGAASVCWEKMDDTGIFQSERAKEIGEKLIEDILGELEAPVVIK